MGSKWLEYLPEESISLERTKKQTNKKQQTKNPPKKGGGIGELSSRSKSVVLETVMDEKYDRDLK